MKNKTYQFFSVSILLIFLLSACSGGMNPLPFAGEKDGTATLPSPQVSVTSAPDARVAMTSFLDAFQVESYATMYSMLSEVSQDTISEEDFILRHKDTLNTMSFSSLDVEILSALTNPFSAQVAYRATYNTVLAGTLERDIVANLTLEEGA